MIDLDIVFLSAFENFQFARPAGPQVCLVRAVFHGFLLSQTWPQCQCARDNSRGWSLGYAVVVYSTL